MSTTPGDEGRRDRPDMPMGQTLGSPGSIARLPMPGNAEFVVYILAVIFLAILWIAMNDFDVPQFTLYFTILTAFYILSRGIAKASRVLEA
jgi:hypothetical protein